MGDHTLILAPVTGSARVDRKGRIRARPPLVRRLDANDAGAMPQPPALIDRRRPISIGFLPLPTTIPAVARSPRFSEDRKIGRVRRGDEGRDSCPHRSARVPRSSWLRPRSLFRARRPTTSQRWRSRFERTSDSPSARQRSHPFLRAERRAEVCPDRGPSAVPETLAPVSKRITVDRCEDPRRAVRRHGDVDAPRSSH